MDKAPTNTLNFPQSMVSSHSPTSEKSALTTALWGVGVGMLPTASYSSSRSWAWDPGMWVMGPREEQTEGVWFEPGSRHSWEANTVSRDLVPKGIFFCNPQFLSPFSVRIEAGKMLHYNLLVKSTCMLSLPVWRIWTTKSDSTEMSL